MAPIAVGTDIDFFPRLGPAWSLTITTPEHAQRMRETNSIPGIGKFQYNIIRTSIDSVGELWEIMKKMYSIPEVVYYTPDVKDSETDKDYLPINNSQLESILRSLAFPLGFDEFVEVNPANSYAPVE